MKESTSYYEGLLKEQDGLNSRLDSASAMKTNLSAVVKSLTEMKSNQLTRVNALRAFSKTLNGTAELPTAIEHFVEKQSETELQESEDEQQEMLTADGESQKAKRRN